MGTPPASKVTGAALGVSMPILRNTALAVGGYAEVSSLQRAFRQWTGHTPNA